MEYVSLFFFLKACLVVNCSRLEGICECTMNSYPYVYKYMYMYVCVEMDGVELPKSQDIVVSLVCLRPAPKVPQLETTHVQRDMIFSSEEGR